MLQQGWVRLYRAFFSLLTLAAVGYQLTLNSQQDAWDPVNFLGFFTIQSNLIAAFILLLGAVASHERRSLVWDVIRGGAAMYMVTTGVVYMLLLTGLEASLQTPSLWVHTVLHQLLPVVMLLDLVVRPIKPGHLTMPRALSWLTWPAIYLAYTLIRGSRIDWYPYPFLDPRPPAGYGTVAVYCVVIVLGLLALSSLIVALTQRPASQPLPHAQPPA